MSSENAVAIVVIVAVGLFAMVMITIGIRRQERKMDELWAAAREVDREWYAALYQYLSAPPVTRQSPRPADDAITVELEVVKPQKLNGEWQGE